MAGFYLEGENNTNLTTEIKQKKIKQNKRRKTLLGGVAPLTQYVTLSKLRQTLIH